MSRTVFFVLLLAVIAGVGFAATPPPLVNYEGVLRDQNGNPLTGTYSMVFRFMDAATLGDEILINQHNAVTVSGGLFNVTLGGGITQDGSGPGSYTSLAAVFRDHSFVWLEVQVGTETLSPRTRLNSSPYALNATNLDGRPASSFIDTSPTTQLKDGQINIRVNSSPWEPNVVDVGVNAAAPTGGGNFLGTGDGSYGVKGRGDAYGGHFQSVSGGMGVRTNGNTYGIYSTAGATGGYFETGGATASIADGATGGRFTGTNGLTVSVADGPNVTAISAGGSHGGTSSYFYNGSPYFSYAYIPNVDRGITAWGSVVGGDFHNFNSGSWAYVGYNVYKIYGVGTVSFVQNHPADPERVIVYAAPEGDEVAVYTRGSGRLVDGEARVKLGQTFALVANPDIGLTATATPRGKPIPLAVNQVSPGELVVQGPAGSDAEFDYMVWGLRIGFEEKSIVQPKQEEARIPSMHTHAQFFQDDPSLRDYTALARFQKIEESVRGRTSVDFSRAEQLRDAIGISPRGEPAPRTDAPGSPHDVPAPTHRPSAAGGPAPVEQDSIGLQESPLNPERGDSTVVSTHSRAAETDDACQARTAAPQEVDLFVAGDSIEPGDVVSLAADSAGLVVRSSGPSDVLLIGCAQLAGTDPRTDTAGNQVAVASSRIALCRVDASYGAVSIGDRLIASPAPGMAMKMNADMAGAPVLGRAIEPLEAGTALVRVLLGVK